MAEENMLRKYTQQLVEMQALGELTVGTVRILAKMMVVAFMEGKEVVLDTNIAAGHEIMKVRDAISEGPF